MNTRPLTPVSDSPDDFSALTPVSLLCGSLESSLPPDVFFKADEYRRSWRAVQLLADLFWRRWLKEYLPLLQRRQKWLQPQRNIKVGDLVLVCDENSKRGAWPKAIVEETFPDREGTVRRVRTASTELHRMSRIGQCLFKHVIYRLFIWVTLLLRRAWRYSCTFHLAVHCAAQL